MANIIGNDARNIRLGTSLADTIHGLGGNDDLFGLGGNDLLFGGTGDDKLFGGTGHDVLFGAAGDDTLFGEAGDDTLKGGGGDDELLGGTGNDVLVPGAGGFDAMDGGAGSDTVSYANLNVSSGVYVDLAVGLGLAAAFGDTFVSVENVIGTKFGDTLALAAGGFAYGGGGNDALSSGAGATLRGDAGLDTLSGDAAKNFTDIFWLQRHAEFDTIIAWDGNQDKLQVSGSQFGIGALLNANELFNRLNNHDATGTKPQFIFDQVAGVLWFDPDGTGGGPAETLASFDAFDTLSVYDFIVTA